MTEKVLAQRYAVRSCGPQDKGVDHCLLWTACSIPATLPCLIRYRILAQVISCLFELRRMAKGINSCCRNIPTHIFGQFILCSGTWSGAIMRTSVRMTSENHLEATYMNRNEISTARQGRSSILQCFVDDILTSACTCSIAALRLHHARVALTVALVWM